MANRCDVISVDKLWDIFDLEREKAWEGVDSPVGTPEWNIAAGKMEILYPSKTEKKFINLLSALVKVEEYEMLHTMLDISVFILKDFQRKQKTFKSLD